MHISSHFENLKESIFEIEQAIIKGITQKQRTLGFHTSAAAADMLEIILHEQNLIDPGFTIKHEWFNSKRKIQEKFPMSFQNKDEIILLISKIEAVRNTLCYGKRQPEEVLERLITDFNQLKKLFEEVTSHEL